MRSTALLVLCTLTLACAADSPPGTPSIRLVDQFDAESLRGSPPEAESPVPTVWDFSAGADGGRDDGSWEVVTGVRGLSVVDGRLTGTTTSDSSLIHLERTSGTGEPDMLHSVEVRLRNSGGTNLAIFFDGSEKPNEQAVMARIGRFPWSATPLIAGEEATTYTLTGPFPASSAATRHIFIRPVDAADATFEIESIRLVFRAEHLAGFPSGVIWQGLAEIYKETLVARVPETIQFDLNAPREPFLTLDLGTPEEMALTFRVDIESQSGGASRSVSRTLTTGNQWESFDIDLEDFGGQAVSLSLSLEGEEGTIGFWGVPVLRARGARGTTSAEAVAGSPEPPQGVILVMVDTLRSDHLEVYGYERPTAPNLAAFAESGALFEDGISQATWTKVSTPSILTSLYPSSHGVIEFPSRLPSAAQTMAEIYRDAGYATINYSSVLFTGKFSNLHQGFEVVHESTSASDKLTAKTARIYTNRVGPWLERHRDVPFFVFFHLFDPHDPYEPEPPYNDLFFDSAVREEHHHEEETVRKVIDDPLRKAFLMPNEEELIEAGLDPARFTSRQVDWYDGSIRGFDSELGRLRAKLDELGLTERTLVIFVSDHGEEFLDHGEMFHGHTVYGELVNVPLMMSWPGVIPAGKRVEQTVQSIDILPTALELSRLAGHDGMQGQSLVPLLLPSPDRNVRPRPAISEQPVISDFGGNPPPFDKGSRSIIWNDWKLIHNHTGRGDLPEFELYRHSEDPLDLENVAEGHADVVEELKQLLDAAHSSAVEVQLASDEEAADSMDQAELERLRALGYIQ